eukprot:TRINITY_DN17502_c0_g1_i1.p1 TRINITY_DN17502_c0_g1~~TRINITY_DN17502_c0_g1_i1.p1  ORF type:complete len:287 (+),score=46.39 TRINITY_DN17502_c0_g1_i1:41-901(+)
MLSVYILADYGIAVLPVIYATAVPWSGVLAAAVLILAEKASNWKADPVALTVSLLVIAGAFISSVFSCLMLVAVGVLCLVAVGDRIWGRWRKSQTLRRIHSAVPHVQVVGEGDIATHLQSAIKAQLEPHLKSDLTFVDTAEHDNSVGLVVIHHIPDDNNEWTTATSICIEECFSFESIKSFVGKKSSTPRFVLFVMDNFPKSGSSPSQEAAANFAFAMIEATRSEMMKKPNNNNVFFTTAVGVEPDLKKSAAIIASSLFERRQVYLPWSRCADRLFSLMSSRREPS